MKNIIVVFSILILSNATFGQDFLSFNDCLNLAVKNNLFLENAIISEKIAVYDLKTRKGKLLPAINGNVENKYSWGRDIDPTTNTFINENFKSYAGNIEATYNLFSGFINLKYIKSAKQEVEINKANIQKIKNDVTIDLAHIYITILYLKETIIVNREQIKASEKQLEMAELKFKSGVIAESEVFKIKSQMATETLLLATNENQLAIYYIDLKQLINIPLEREIELIKPNLLLDENVYLIENQLSLTKKAVELHPSFLMSELMENKAKTAISIARSYRMPSLSLKFAYGSKYSDKNSMDFNQQVETNLLYGIKLNMEIPIFNQFETSYRIKQSKLSYKQSKLNSQIEQNRLSRVVLQAINDAKAAKKKQESSTIAFEFAQKSFDSDQLKYDLGKININELNFTKTNYTNAQAELIRAKYELLFNNALINFYLGEDFSL
ncbi:TolC family protein [Flavobacterium sp.]|uniref:TolC family protein n=1 Tax=Flavobacterium sp. TaxID=239 RepID=UPI002B4AB778|nr:TolC family protein [Flavobacterium sp.]HLF52722.1 TolC family protein [Flavobacterium sp.]